jgi:DnaJ-class molecular chaperone
LKRYKILQVDRDAEQEVIEAAYKCLAGKYHPDKDPSASATQRMQKINAAYEILRDPERRGRFDREQRRKKAEQNRPQVVDVVYREEFSSRFQAAAPDKATQSVCLNQVNLRPVAIPR